VLPPQPNLHHGEPYAYGENMKHFDVVVLGAGSAGELISKTLAEAGKSVALIEKLRVGGECAYVSCIPSKAMLRSAQVRNLAKEFVALGASSKPIELVDAEQAFDVAILRRDRIADNREDSAAAQGVIDSGVELIRGEGKFSAVDRIVVNGDEITWTDMVISTGSSVSIPPIPGLATSNYWTSDVALSESEYPKSVLIIGAGPVGCELSQIYSAFGVATTLVEAAAQLAGKEAPEIAQRLARNLAAEGVKVLLDTKVEKIVTGSDLQSSVHFSDGSSITVERIIVATGRHPNTAHMNFDMLGIYTDEKGAVLIDDHCRVVGQDHVWAGGDVTGVAPYTHTANYQGRIITSNILGRDMKANYSAIPRVIYTDPAVASVGTLHVDGSDDGLISAKFELNGLSRNSTDGLADDKKSGLLILSADPIRKILVGAAAIGPHADEWLAEATLAIRAQVPLSILCDVVHAFPTYSQAFEIPLRELAGLAF